MTDLLVTSVASPAFGGAAVASGQIVASGAGAVALQARAVTSTTLQVAGVSFPTFGGAVTASGSFYAGSEALVDFRGAARYASMPRAQDYVIHPVELRGVIRPAEVRVAIYQ